MRRGGEEGCGGRVQVRRLNLSYVKHALRPQGHEAEQVRGRKENPGSLTFKT